MLLTGVPQGSIAIIPLLFHTFMSISKSSLPRSTEKNDSIIDITCTPNRGSAVT